MSPRRRRATAAALPEIPLPIPADPITAIALAVIAISRLAEKVIETQPKEVAGELWKLHLEDLKAWRAFWHLPGSEPDHAIISDAVHARVARKARRTLGPLVPKKP